MRSTKRAGIYVLELTLCFAFSRLLVADRPAHLRAACRHRGPASPACGTAGALPAAYTLCFSPCCLYVPSSLFLILEDARLRAVSAVNLSLPAFFCWRGVLARRADRAYRLDSHLPSFRLLLIYYILSCWALFRLLALGAISICRFYSTALTSIPLPASTLAALYTWACVTAATGGQDCCWRREEGGREDGARRGGSRCCLPRRAAPPTLW